MTTLTKKVKDQAKKLQKIKSICYDLIIQQDWNKEVNEQKTQKILILTNIIKILDLSPEHNMIKRILFFEKVKNFLPK